MSPASKPLRAVIVDDEEPARLALRQALEAIGDVEVVAECAHCSGESTTSGHRLYRYCCVQ